MPVERGSRSNVRYHPPGVRRTSWTRAARVADAQAQRRAWTRRRAKNRIVSVPRAKLAFPTGMRTKLRFCIRSTLNNAAADNIAKVSFLANSLTDPYVGGANHQPRGFDQFMGVYRTYTVLGSKISVNFMYQAYDGPTELDNDTSTYLIKTVKEESNGAKAAALTPLMVGIHKGVTELGATESSSQVMEQDRTVWRAMTPQDGSLTVSTSMRTSDFFGKGTLVGAEGYTGTITSDVDNKIYYNVWMGRASGQTNGNVHAIGYVTIEYDVMFTEPKTLGES